MTWAEFKQTAERIGIGDETELKYIDVDFSDLEDAWARLAQCQYVDGVGIYAAINEDALRQIARSNEPTHD